MNIQASWNVDS